jgi:hypothetical protein
MNRLVLAAILIAAGLPLMAKDNPAAQQSLDTARKPADLFQGTADPFELEFDFTTQTSGPIHGHLSLKWQSKDHW